MRSLLKLISASFLILFFALTTSCNNTDDAVTDDFDVPEVMYTKDSLPAIITLPNNFITAKGRVELSTNGLGSAYFVKAFRNVIYYQPDQREAGEDLITYQVMDSTNALIRQGEIQVILLGDSNVDDLDDCTRNVGFSDYVKVEQGSRVEIKLNDNDDFCMEVYDISGRDLWGFGWGTGNTFGAIQATHFSWAGATFSSSGLDDSFIYEAPDDFIGRLVRVQWVCFGAPDDDPTLHPNFPHNCEYQSTTFLIVDVTPK